MKIAHKMTALAVGGVLVLGAVSVVMTTAALRKAGRAEIAEIEEQMLAAKKEKLQDLVKDVYTMVERAYKDAHDPQKVAEIYREPIRNLVNVAYGAVRAVYDNPEILTWEKMDRAKAIVKQLRYGEKGYFWINDTHPTMVMHPIKPQLDDKDLTDFEDPNGKKLFQEFVRVCEEKGEGFVDYLWPKPGQDEPVPKLSYVKLFEPWGWIIGTGVYLQAAEARIQEDLLRTIAAMRYGAEGKDYFWVNDMDSVVLMHPIKPSLNGKDMSDLKDEKGTYIFREFVRTCRENGGGFVEYWWPKPGHDQPVHKLSYVKLFEPWGWVIGTGLYLDDIHAKLASVEADVNAKITRQIWTQVGVIAAITLLMAGLTGVLTRRVSRPIVRVTGMLRDIAEGEGDLTKRIDVESHDEVGEMAHCFNVFADKMCGLVGQIKAASQEMAAVSEQLSGATSQIAASNNEVSSQTQTLATSGEEMGATVQEVAQNAAAVSGAARRARQAAADGSRVVGEALEALTGIAQVVEQAGGIVRALGDRAETIGTVIQVIEDIADQTNLLALNAAIEAARAGEHGRGFAVVADEVRKLAEKTMKATHEIGETIASIQAEGRKAVEAMDEGMASAVKGRELGEGAGRSMQDVEAQVTEAASQTEQIAAATEELSATIQAMATNLEQIAEGIGQNTQAVTEIARTAETVASRAEELRDLTGRFRTTRDTGQDA